MKQRTRIGLVATATTAVVLLSGQQAFAGSGATAVQYNGATKAKASYGQSYWAHLCADLYAGYKATATMGGNSVSDYSPGNGPTCIEIYNVGSGLQYQLSIYWTGTGSGSGQNNTVVIAN